MKNFALIGSNISGSLSPSLWRFLARKTGTDLSYALCDLPSDAPDAALMSALASYDGANITSPFKNRVAALLNLSAPVNTVSIAANIACSTDGLGVAMALDYCGIDVWGKSLLAVGAGGSAESAVKMLSCEGAKIACVNRTPEKARELARKYGLPARCGLPFGILSFLPKHADAMGLVEKTFLDSAEFFFDANYGSPSPLLSFASERGKTAIDGLPMLFFQGVAGFKLLTGADISDPFDLYEEWLKYENPDC